MVNALFLSDYNTFFIMTLNKANAISTVIYRTFVYFEITECNKGLILNILVNKIYNYETVTKVIVTKFINV